MQFRHVKRRELITLLAGAVIPPLPARAQAMPVIAFLSTVSAEAAADNVLAFKQGLGQAGFIEGKNLAIEYRWAGGDYNRLAALASDLASRDIKAIAATGGSISALAAKAATATIPIVFAFGDADPLQNGLVPASGGRAVILLELPWWAALWGRSASSCSTSWYRKRSFFMCSSIQITRHCRIHNRSRSSGAAPRSGCCGDASGVRERNRRRIRIHGRARGASSRGVERQFPHEQGGTDRRTCCAKCTAGDVPVA